MLTPYIFFDPCSLITTRVAAHDISRTFASHGRLVRRHRNRNWRQHKVIVVIDDPYRNCALRNAEELRVGTAGPLTIINDYVGALQICNHRLRADALGWSV